MRTPFTFDPAHCDLDPLPSPPRKLCNIEYESKRLLMKSGVAPEAGPGGGVHHNQFLAADRLREASVGHLRVRVALPLEAPRDWTRTNPLKCSCSDCRELGGFLLAPDQKQWRLTGSEEPC